MSPTVDVLLVQMTGLVGLLQPEYAPVTVMDVLPCALLTIAYEQTATTALVYLVQHAVLLGKGQYLPPHIFRLVLDAAAYYVLAAVGFKVVDVRIIHQAGICHDDEVVKLILADELAYDGQHRMSLILIALVDAVGQRIAVKAHQQAEDNLRIAVAAFLREAGPAQIVLTVRLKIQRLHATKQDSFHKDNAHEETQAHR